MARELARVRNMPFRGRGRQRRHEISIETLRALHAAEDPAARRAGSLGGIRRILGAPERLVGYGVARSEDCRRSFVEGGGVLRTAPTVPPAQAAVLRQETARGATYAGGAFLLWGLFPLYWRLLERVSAIELSAHRVVWSFLFLTAFLFLRGRGREFWEALADRRVLLRLLLTSVLLGANFVTFIYAVETHRVLQASLGYFINPMLNILLGRLFFGETLSGVKGWAVLFAALGVLQMAALAGEFPWIALVLASAFAVYGLIRKTARVASLPGTAVEAMLLSVLGGGWVVYLEAHGAGHFLAAESGLRALIVLSGVVTSVPLVLFAAGARRISLGALGFMQFIAPTLQFAIAVWLFGETLSLSSLSSFACIWIGVGLFVIGSSRGGARA